MRLATIIGTRDGVNWESLAAGPSNEVLPAFRSGSLSSGFSKVIYLDTGGNQKRRKGTASGPKPKRAAKKGKKAPA